MCFSAAAICTKGATLSARGCAQARRSLIQSTLHLCANVAAHTWTGVMCIAQQALRMCCCTPGMLASGCCLRRAALKQHQYDSCILAHAQG
jgi:hypothetical protein